MRANGRLMLALGCVASVLSWTARAQVGGEPEPRVVRLGAVAYAPAAVTIFEGIRRYLGANGLPADYVLYSNYDALVEALEAGQVDIAWNTPLAHARYHVACGGKSQTLVMRDVDVGFRSVLVARKDARVTGPKDLAGKRLVLGSRDAAEATVLPRHYLEKEGVDFGAVTIVSLDDEVDLKGNPCSSEHHVLQALRAGRGDAGIIGERLWERVAKGEAKADLDLELVWRTPPFSHCVFTASADFDPTRAARFRDLMLAMDPTDPTTSELMRLEGTSQWRAGSSDGFVDLVSALASPPLGAAEEKRERQTSP